MLSLERAPVTIELHPPVFNGGKMLPQLLQPVHDHVFGNFKTKVFYRISLNSKRFTSMRLRCGYRSPVCARFEFQLYPGILTVQKDKQINFVFDRPKIANPCHAVEPFPDCALCGGWKAFDEGRIVKIDLAEFTSQTKRHFTKLAVVDHTDRTVA